MTKMKDQMKENKRVKNTDWEREKERERERERERKRGGCPRSVMVKAIDCRIVVSEFVLQSHYYVHFRANTLRKGMNLLILQAMG